MWSQERCKSCRLSILLKSFRRAASLLGHQAKGLEVWGLKLRAHGAGDRAVDTHAGAQLRANPEVVSPSIS